MALAPRRSSSLRHYVREAYVRVIRPHIAEPASRQRLKLAWFAWGYWPLMKVEQFSMAERLTLLRRFLRVDWNVVHGHRPCEIASIAAVLAQRRARPGEIMVEAGCWQGGSSAKFSILCKMLGYSLHVYDSFEGVEAFTEEMKQTSYDFSGEYAAPEALVRDHVTRFGEVSVCSFHKGWFSATLAAQPLTAPIRVVYIDCDVAKGTFEVLSGATATLADDGRVFSQDYHLAPVRSLLNDPTTWASLALPEPAITQLCGNLAALAFTQRGRREAPVT